MDAWRPWIRSAEVQGGGGGGRGCRDENWNITTTTCVNEQLFHIRNGLYCVQSGVFLTKFGHRILLFLSGQPDNV